MADWKIIPQVEKQGKQENIVLVKRLQGFMTRKDGAQVFIRMGAGPNKEKPCVMLQALVGVEGSSELPVKITFSQRWIDNRTGLTYEGKGTPNPLCFFKRNKVTIKFLKEQYYREELAKRSTTKVTQRVPVEPESSGAHKDDNEEWFILVDKIKPQEYELNSADGSNHWNQMLLYLNSQFGLEVAKTFGKELLQRANELKAV